jgi:hypothetical protein
MEKKRWKKRYSTGASYSGTHSCWHSEQKILLQVEEWTQHIVVLYDAKQATDFVHDNAVSTSNYATRFSWSVALNSSMKVRAPILVTTPIWLKYKSRVYYTRQM